MERTLAFFETGIFAAFRGCTGFEFVLGDLKAGVCSCVVELLSC